MSHEEKPEQETPKSAPQWRPSDNKATPPNSATPFGAPSLQPHRLVQPPPLSLTSCTGFCFLPLSAVKFHSSRTFHFLSGSFLPSSCSWYSIKVTLTKVMRAWTTQEYRLEWIMIAGLLLCESICSRKGPEGQVHGKTLD